LTRESVVRIHGGEPSAIGLMAGRLLREQDIRLVQFQHRRPCAARSLVRASALQAEPAGFDPLAAYHARVAQPAEAADLKPAQCSFESSRAHPLVRPVAAARLIST
jgi:hypothetical protein